jgi:apolipoprotein D and lipocalin family protein
MRMLVLAAGAFMMLLSFGAAGSDELSPLQTIPKVDLQRYMGVWYEIAAFPQRSE